MNCAVKYYHIANVQSHLSCKSKRKWEVDTCHSRSRRWHINSQINGIIICIISQNVALRTNWPGAYHRIVVNKLNERRLQLNRQHLKTLFLALVWGGKLAQHCVCVIWKLLPLPLAETRINYRQWMILYFVRSFHYHTLVAKAAPQNWDTQLTQCIQILQQQSTQPMREQESKQARERALESALHKMHLLPIITENCLHVPIVVDKRGKEADGRTGDETDLYARQSAGEREGQSTSQTAVVWLWANYKQMRANTLDYVVCLKHILFLMIFLHSTIYIKRFLNGILSTFNGFYYMYIKQTKLF